MQPEKFAERYLQNEQEIKKTLNSLEIYDEDLLHDTYIALYEHALQAQINDFTSVFVAFYRTRCKRRDEHESHYECCDHETMVEKYDRIDEDEVAYREIVGKAADSLYEWFVDHPMPGERNHARAVHILRLHLDGFSYVEIAKMLKIHESTAKKYKKRVILHLKSHGKMATI